MKREACAMYRPGHILGMAIQHVVKSRGERLLGKEAPSAETKRESIGVTDAGIQLAVPYEALRAEFVWVFVGVGIVHHLPIRYHP